MPCWDFVGVNSNCTMGLFWGRYRFFYLKIRLGTLCLFQNALLLLVENHFYELIGQIFEKSGEIRVRDNCARKRVKYRVQHRSTVIRVKYSFKNGQGSSPTYHSLFSTVSFLFLFDNSSYKTPICILSEDDNLVLGIHSSHNPSFMAIPRLRGKVGQISFPKQSHRAIQHKMRAVSREIILTGS